MFSQNYLPWIRKHIKEVPVSFLDYGCGTGNLILVMKESGFRDAEGCEFADDAFAPLQRKGISDFRCSDLKNQSKKYSHVSMMDVIEHLREPL